MTGSTAMQSSLPPAITNLPTDNVPAHHANPVVAFIIGLAIVLLASILNAAGLNLTKLDHVCFRILSAWLLTCRVGADKCYSKGF